MHRLEPGERAVFTGLYKAVHADGHLPPHYVIALQGDAFPHCTQCADRVRFELAVSARHVHADAQFKHRAGED